MKRKVIAGKNLPMNPPLAVTLVWYLFLDKVGASGIWWGVIMTIMAFVWLVWLINAFNQEPIDLFRGRND